MWEEFIPHIEGESDVYSSKGGNNVVFGCADISFCEVGTMVVGGNKLNYTGRGTGFEEVAYRLGRFIVRDQMCDCVVTC